MSDPGTHCRQLVNNLTTIIRGQTTSIRHLVAAFLSGGHVLLEDYPGTGKTSLAKALALSIEEADFRRIQFTPDLLPNDILGVSIWNPKDDVFKFHPGPIFSHILLADEINRASPRTQSALLEAMAEGQVTIEGKSKRLTEHFFVIATQNPVEFRGTYPLPEAQMDRFAMRCSMGYVPRAEEINILTDQQQQHPLHHLQPCLSLATIADLKRAAEAMTVSDELKAYIVDLVSETRKMKDVELAASPRASLALMKCAQVLALMDGADFVTPDHIQELAVAVIAHRIVLNPQAKFNGTSESDIVEKIVEQLKVPA